MLCKCIRFETLIYDGFKFPGARIVKVMRKGDICVVVKERVDANYHQVFFNGVVGYVYSKSIEEIKE